MNGLLSFQEALSQQLITPRPGQFNSSLSVMEDNPNGELRITHARIVAEEVHGTVMYCVVDPVDLIPCFSVGYAVSEERRRQGVGATLLQESIEELRRKMFRVGVKDFYIEAIVGINNVASNGLATKILARDPVSTTDKVSGEPAFQYLKRIKE